MISLMAVVLATGLLAGCSDKSPQTPTAPAGTAQSLTITGPATLEESESVTLAISVRYTRGATETVTQGVAWAAENPAVATVNASGVVTALAPGQGGIRATFDGVSATFKITVSAGLRLLTGRVHESKPTENVGIARATVSAVDSNGTPQSATPDADGNFSMRMGHGAAAFTIAAPGYDTAQILVAIPREDGSALSLPLSPVFAEVRDIHEQNLAAPRTDQRTYKVPVHHPGQLLVTVTDGNLSDSWNNACLEVRDDRNVVLARTQGFFDIYPADIRVSAVAGTLYEVKLLECPIYAVGGFFVNMNRIAFEVRHPS